MNRLDGASPSAAKMRNGRRIFALLTHAAPILLVFLFLVASASATTGWKKLSFATASDAQCIVADADFNKDAKPDVAVASLTEKAVAVHYGDGNGNFSVASKFATGNFPDCVKSTGHFDGARLLAVIGHSPNTLVLLLADNNGNFTIFDTIPLPFAPRDFAISDFNDDFFMDFAIVGGTNQVMMVYRHSSGTTSQLITVPGAQSLSSITMGLFHPGGGVDLAVLSCCGDGNKLSLFTLLNDDAGNFTVKPTLTFTGYNQGRLQTEASFLDFNGDHLSDVALMTANNQGEFSYTNGNLLLTNGDGTFRFSHSYLLPNPTRTFSGKPFLIDLDHDGVPDFVISGEQQYTAGSVGDSDVWVWYLKKDGSVKSSQKITLHTSGFSLGTTWNFPRFSDSPRPNLLALSSEVGSATDKIYSLKNTPFCQAPTSTGINICSPSSNASYRYIDWVEILASGFVGGAKAKYMEAWMDGKKLANVSGSTVYVPVRDLTVGTHKVTIFASNGTGTKISKVVFFNSVEP